MSLPKTLTPKLIKELNKACEVFMDLCDCECDNVGWCDACWIVVGGGQPAPQGGGDPDNTGNTGCEAAADNASDMSAEPRDKYERDLRVQQRT